MLCRQLEYLVSFDATINGNIKKVRQMRGLTSRFGWIEKELFKEVERLLEQLFFMIKILMHSEEYSRFLVLSGNVLSIRIRLGQLPLVG